LLALCQSVKGRESRALVPDNLGSRLSAVMSREDEERQVGRDARSLYREDSRYEAVVEDDSELLRWLTAWVLRRVVLEVEKMMLIWVC